MGLFDAFRKSSAAHTALVIDIGSASVAGAYVRVGHEAPPEIAYAAHAPIERRAGESEPLEGMRRSLEVLADSLVRDGSPALMRAYGQAHADRILIAAGIPWGETRVRTERIQKGKPFAFTRALVREVCKGSAADGRRTMEDRVIATLLDGYEVRHPYGRRASYAEITVLSSTMAEAAAAAAENAIARAFHTRRTELHAFMPAAYAVLKELYPLQKDHFIIAAGAEQTEVALVSRGVLVGARSAPGGISLIAQAAHSAGVRANADPISGDLAAGLIDAGRNQRFSGAIEKAKSDWLAAVRTEMLGFASDLPSTVFLITDKASRGLLADALGDASLGNAIALGTPITVIPLSGAHLGSAVRVRADTDPDTALMLLALYESQLLGERLREGDTPLAPRA